MSTSTVALAVACFVVAGMLLRPWQSREWQWAAGGALATIVLRIQTRATAWHALAGGWNVYAFLTGIAILAEVARAQGVFDALALRARLVARGSRRRLFLLIYSAGVGVTALLSNDTTALVLTPAVFAALDSTGVEPLPYLYACAFVANAASFALPFSNPANLVVFGDRLPSLGGWGAGFGLAALGAVIVTYLMLAWTFTARLRKPMGAAQPSPLRPQTKLAMVTLTGAAAGMIVTAAAGWNIGLATLVLALAAVAVVSIADRSAPRVAARHLPWQILPLVGGLFVVIDALDRSGGLGLARGLLTGAATLGSILGGVATSLTTALASCAFNNLPVAMATAFARGAFPSDRAFHAAVTGIDLGPNLCVTGSLSTLLWLIALRREGIEVSAGAFFRVGLRVGIPALLVAAVLLR